MEILYHENEIVGWLADDGTFFRTLDDCEDYMNLRQNKLPSKYALDKKTEVAPAPFLWKIYYKSETGISVMYYTGATRLEAIRLFWEDKPSAPLIIGVEKLDLSLPSEGNV